VLTFRKFEHAVAEVAARLYQTELQQDPYSPHLSNEDRQWALGHMLRRHVVPLFTRIYGHLASEEHEYAAEEGSEGDGASGEGEGEGERSRSPQSVLGGATVLTSFLGHPALARSRASRNAIDYDGIHPLGSRNHGSAVPLNVHYLEPTATVVHDPRIMVSVASPVGAPSIVHGHGNRSHGLFGRSASRGGSAYGGSSASSSRGGWEEEDE